MYYIVKVGNPTKYGYKRLMKHNRKLWIMLSKNKDSGVTVKETALIRYQIEQCEKHKEKCYDEKTKTYDVKKLTVVITKLFGRCI